MMKRTEDENKKTPREAQSPPAILFFWNWWDDNSDYFHLEKIMPATALNLMADCGKPPCAGAVLPASGSK